MAHDLEWALAFTIVIGGVPMCWMLGLAAMIKAGSNADRDDDCARPTSDRGEAP